MGAAVVVLTGLVPLATLADRVNIGTLFAFVLVAAGLLWLRRSDPPRERPFRTPLAPLVPLLSIVASLYLMASLSLDTWLRFLVWLVVGVLVYFVYSRSRSLVGRGEAPSRTAEAPTRAQSAQRRCLGAPAPFPLRREGYKVIGNARQELLQKMEAGSTGTAGRPDTREGAARTLAQTFCLVVGAVLVLVGVLGFIFGSSAFVAGTDVQGSEFIIFEVNGWHNIVHLATGAFLLLMAGTARTAVLGALIFGVVYIVVAIWGFVDGNDVISLVPINEPDTWLHLILGLLGLAVGFSAGGLAATANGGGTTAERTP